MPTTLLTSTARFSGPLSQYMVALLPSGLVQVTERSPAGQGKVVLVEQAAELRFDDATFRLSVAQSQELKASSVGAPHGPEESPQITVLKDGSLMLSWLSPDPDAPGDLTRVTIWGRHLAADGSALSDAFQIATGRSPTGGLATQGVPEQPRLAATADGGFAAVWRADRPSGQGSDILAQVFSPQGDALQGPQRINSTADSAPLTPSLSAFADGRTVLAWIGRLDSSAPSASVLLRTLGDTAGAATQPVLVSQALAGSPSAATFPAITVLADGATAVAWTEQTGSQSTVRWQIVEADGRPRGAVGTLSAPGTATQKLGSIQALADGGFVLAYENHCVNQCFDDVRVQRVNATGSARGESARVNESALSSSLNVSPQLDVRADGTLAVAWASYDVEEAGWNIRLRLLDSVLAPLGASMVVHQSTAGQQLSPDVAFMSNGLPLVAWQQASGQGDPWTVSARAAIDGTGSMAVYTLLGGSGPDTLELQGASVIDGKEGADRMIGDGGNTTYVYDVTEDLAIERPAGGYDTLLSTASLRMPDNIEAVQLLGAAPLRAWGNESANRITGNSGDNLLHGGGGHDELDGAGGNDTLIGDAGNDTLIGGQGDDLLTDDLGVNRLEGGPGQDTFDLQPAPAPGGTVDGGPGVDRLLMKLGAMVPALVVRNVEVFDGLNAAAPVQAVAWLSAQGFSSIVNLMIRMDPGSNSRRIDISGLKGSISIQGSNAGDLLVGNDDANRIELLADTSGDPVGGRDSVRAGGGDDEVIWAVHPGRPALEFFNGFNQATLTYQLSPHLDGGAGVDTLVLDFGNTVLDGANRPAGWIHSWNQEPARGSDVSAWSVDLSGATLRDIEQIVVKGYSTQQAGLFPSAVIISPAQAAAAVHISGLEGSPAALVVAGSGPVDNIVTGTDLADRLMGTNRPDLIRARAGDDTIDAGEGNDVIIPGGGRNGVDGGAGVDTVVFDGLHSDHDLRVDPLTRVVTVSSRSKPSDVTVASRVEWLQFADQRVAGPQALDLGDAYRLFVVAFGAAPGATWMREVAQAYEAGASTRDIAGAFTEKSAFTALHDPRDSNQSFAEQLIERVVGSTAPAQAKAMAAAQLSAALNGGASRADALFALSSNLSSLSSQDPVWGSTVSLLNNQVAIARYHAEVLGNPSTNIEELRSVLAWVGPQSDTSTTDKIRALFNNRAPQLPAQQSVSGHEDTPISFNVVATDGDAGDVLTYTAQRPANGTIAVGQDGSFRYQPNHNFFGADQVLVTATDRAGAVAVQRVDILVLPVNDPPLSVVDPVREVLVGQTILLDVTANDTDLDGPQITLSGTPSSSLGVASYRDGQLQFTAPADSAGPVQIAYAISDGLSTTPALQWIQVLPPILRSSAASVGEGSAFTLTVSGAPLGRYQVRLTGSAQPGSDYGNSNSSLISVETDERGTAQIELDTFRDKLTEGDETLTASLVGGLSSVNVTIADTSLNNVAPVFRALPALAGTEDVLLRFAMPVATDANADDTVTYGLGMVEGGTARLAQGPGQVLFVEFEPAPNRSGPASVVVTASDGTATTAIRIDFAVQPVNDAPTVDLNGNDPGTNTQVRYAERQMPVPIAPAATLRDLDSSLISGILITLEQPQPEDILGFSSPAGSNIRGAYDAKTGVLRLEGVAPIAIYEAALRSVTYFNRSDNPNIASRVITVLVDDGQPLGNLGNVASATVIVSASNSAPSIDLNGEALGTGYSISFTENGAGGLLAPAGRLEDTDSTQLSGLTVTIANVLPEDRLNFNADAGSSITSSYDPVQGRLQLRGTATVDEYQAALRSISYSNTSDNPNTTTRNIRFEVFDVPSVNGQPTATSNSASTMVALVAVNDPPAVDPNGGDAGAGVPRTFTENDAPLAFMPAVKITDPDTTTLAGAIVRLDNPQAGETLNFNAQSGAGVITGLFAAATGTLTLTGTASLSRYEAALREVSYFNASKSPVGGNQTISVLVNDGQPGNGLSNIVTVQITVAPVNDAPVLDLNGPGPGDGSALTYTENQSATVVAPNAVLSDVDSAMLVGAVITLAAPTASERLTWVNPLGSPISGDYDPGTGRLALSGTATLAQYQVAIRSVAFENTSDNFNAGDRGITVQLNDGSAVQGLSTVTTATITLVPVNDAPVADLNGPAPGNATSFSYIENQAARPLMPDAVASDLDSTSLTRATVTLAGAGPEEVLGFNAPAGSGITGTYSAATGVLTLAGVATLGQYQAALRAVTYSYNSESPLTSPRTVSVRLDDGSAANAESIPRTVNVSITALNDPPTIDLNGALAGTGTLTNYLTPLVAQPLAPTATLSDADSPSLVSLTITLQDPRAEDELAFNAPVGSSIVGTYDPATGRLVLSGPASAAQYDAALKTVSYRNASIDPNPTPRSISVVADDGSSENRLSSPVSLTLNVTAGIGDDDLRGTLRDDVLIGGDGNDTLTGDAGNDHLIGDAGDDLFILGDATTSWLTSQDSIVGGAGSADTLRITLANNSMAILDSAYANVSGVERLVVQTPAVLSLNLGAASQAAGIVEIVLAAGNVLNAATYTVALKVSDGGGHENITTGSGNDTITTGDGNDTVNAGDGADSITLGSGIDRIDAGPGNDTVTEGSGLGSDDTLIGGAGIDLLVLNARATSADGVGSIVLLTLDESMVNFSGFESLSLLPGLAAVDRFSTPDDAGSINRYLISLSDAQLTPGVTFKVTASGLRSSVVYDLGADKAVGGAAGTPNADVAADESLSFSATAVTASSVSVVGGEGADTLVGSSLNDTLLGGGGQDIFNAGAGADSVVGGDGGDTFFISGTANDANDTLSGGNGIDVLRIRASTVFAPVDANITGIERIIIEDGGNFDVSLAGQTEALDITGGDSNNSIVGGQGPDTLTGGAGADSLAGGAGNDVFLYASQADFLAAGAVIDSIDGGANTDSIRVAAPLLIATTDSLARVTGTESLTQTAAGAASIILDTNAKLGSLTTFNISASTAASTLNFAGVTTALTLTCGTAEDVVTGGAGNDTITAGDGPDTLTGGAGADSLAGGAGNDVFLYASQADFLAAGAVIDSIDGGANTDSIRVAAPLLIATTDSLARVTGTESLTQTAAGAASIILDTNAKLGSLTTFNISASTAASTLNFAGVTVGVNLKAGGGNDQVTGGAGNDTLDGFGGSDTFNLSSGGVDTVLFSKAASAGNADTVTGFSSGAGAGADQIALSLQSMNATVGLLNLIAQGATGAGTSTPVAATAVATVIQDVGADNVSLGGSVTAIRLTGTTYTDDAAVLADLKTAGSRTILLDYSDSATNEADAILVIYSRTGGGTAIAVLNLGGTANAAADNFDNVAIGEATAALTTIITLVGTTATEVIPANIIFGP